jgi:hypothetical protein
VQGFGAHTVTRMIRPSPSHIFVLMFTPNNVYNSCRTKYWSNCWLKRGNRCADVMMAEARVVGKLQGRCSVVDRCWLLGSRSYRMSKTCIAIAYSR